jgi:hypothetical protein
MENTGAGGLGWALLIMLIAAVGVGWLAQSWKRRTGAAWGCGTFVLMMLMFLVLYFAMYSNNPQLFHQNSGWAALGVVVAILGGLLLALIVATLPRRG